MTPLGILHLATFLQGGAGRAIADLAIAQHAAGHRVAVVTSHTAVAAYGNYPEYLDRLRENGIAVQTCDSLFTRDVAVNMRVVDRLCELVDAGALDVVHAHAAVPAFVGLSYISRTGHDIAIVQTQHGWGINKTPAQAAFDIDMLRRVQRVITTSRATAEQLVGFGVPAATVAFVPCGLAPERPDAPPKRGWRAVEPFHAQGLPVIGCIGSVTPNKNQRLVVDALASGDLNAAAVFVGEGGESLVQYARERGISDRVAAVGYQPHASSWLPLFDLLVVPSRAEGQGLVVLEAFRAGVPVVASRIPALAELIDDGRTGFLVDSDDAAALAASVRHALALTAVERRALISAGEAVFEAEFTLERMAGRHEALYQVLIAEGAEIAGAEGAEIAER